MGLILIIGTGLSCFILGYCISKRYERGLITIPKGEHYIPSPGAHYKNIDWIYEGNKRPSIFDSNYVWAPGRNKVYPEIKHD